MYPTPLDKHERHRLWHGLIVGAKLGLLLAFLMVLGIVSWLCLPLVAVVGGVGWMVGSGKAEQDL